MISQSRNLSYAQAESKYHAFPCHAVCQVYDAIREHVWTVRFFRLPEVLFRNRDFVGLFCVCRSHLGIMQ